MMKRLIVYFLLTVTFFPWAMAQESIKVSGTVTDSMGPMVGVSIVEKGTTDGTMTDLDGSYSITVRAGSILQVSCIGYVTREIPADRARIDIILEEDTQMLEETVVVGYGVQKKSSVTGAISSIKNEDIQNRTILSVEQGLQGKTAGVQIVSGSASPGSSPSVRIRGISSNASSDPLYVVDGLRMTSIASIDPNDIESMEILKDAASAAIYGAEAGNGVVLITTKKAKEGVRTVSYDFQFTTQKFTRIPEVLNAQEYIQYMLEGGFLTEDTIYKYWDGSDTNWREVGIESSAMARHNVSFQSASKAGSVYAGASYSGNNGPVVGNEDIYKRLTATLNADFSVTPWLKFSTNNQFSKSGTKSPTTGAAGSVLGGIITLDPLTPVKYAPDQLPDFMQTYLALGRVLLTDDDGNYYSISPFQTSQNCNPYLLLGRNKAQENNRYNLHGSTALDFTFIKGLVFTSRLGYNFTWADTYQFNQPRTENNETTQKYAQVTATSGTDTYWQWENFINWNHAFGRKHMVNAMLGTSFSESSSVNISASIKGDDNNLGILKNDANYAYFAYQTAGAIKTISGGEKLLSAKMSYFGRAGYEYDNRYYIQASLRADAADTSYLPKASRWGLFPAVSGGWVISNEGFFNVPAVNQMKLRASWGRNGSIAGLGGYMYAASLASEGNYSYSTSNNSIIYQAATAPSSTGNDNLKWETSEQLDFGLDLRMLRDRLTFTADAYWKTTKDLIITGAKSSLTVGNTPSPINAGNVSNRGLEFELGWKDSVGDFHYGINANLSTLHNKVTHIPENMIRIAGGSTWKGVLNYFEAGYPMWYMRGYEFTGVDPDTGNPTFKDQLTVPVYAADGKTVDHYEADGILNDDDKVMIGSGIPDYTCGITFTAGWKGFDLIVFGSGAYGNDVMYGMCSDRATFNTLKEFYDGRWTAAGQTAKYPRASQIVNSDYYMSSAMVYDGSYFKIKQIQLGYSLPEKLLQKVSVKGMRMYASLDDAFTFTKYIGYDPEIAGEGSSLGIDNMSYPTTRKIVFGVNVTF